MHSRWRIWRIVHSFEIRIACVAWWQKTSGGFKFNSLLVKVICCKRLMPGIHFNVVILIRWFWLTNPNVLCSSQCCMSFSLEVGLVLHALSIFATAVCWFSVCCYWSAEVDVWEIAPRFSDLLSNTGIQFLRDRVKTLLPCDHLGANGSESSVAGGTVLLESGFLIEYDWYHLIRFLSCWFIAIQRYCVCKL